jgi:ankyrin repeat protein
MALRHKKDKISDVSIEVWQVLCGAGPYPASNRLQPAHYRLKPDAPGRVNFDPVSDNPSPIEQFKRALFADDADALTQLLEQNPNLKSQIDEPAFPFDCPAIVTAAGRANRAVIDALLNAGANVNARSRWWAGSFGVLDNSSPEMAAHLIERGAIVDVHAAARLGMLHKLQELISASPPLVHARGGDGKMPLHFASTVEIADYLLNQGAEIDALDIDHESTAAQHLIAEHPHVVRHLVSRGAKTDILLAAALGDIDLISKHLEADPESIRMQVNDKFFPKRNPHSGGTIYIWTLGNRRSPLQVASKFNYREAVQLLMDRSPDDMKLLNACLLGEDALVESLRANIPGGTDGSQVSDAAEDNNIGAVRLMLESGWPVDGGPGATPLHWAAWHGNREMADVVLRYNPPLEKANASTFNATPLGWAIHGSEHGWHCKTGDYGAVVLALLAAGAKPPEEVEGSPTVRDALTRPRPV